MSILNTAGSYKFSSDRTIREYSEDIWDIKPLLLPWRAIAKVSQVASCNNHTFRAIYNYRNCLSKKYFPNKEKYVRWEPSSTQCWSVNLRAHGVMGVEDRWQAMCKSNVILRARMFSHLWMFAMCSSHRTLFLNHILGSVCFSGHAGWHIQWLWSKNV